MMKLKSTLAFLVLLSLLQVFKCEEEYVQTYCGRRLATTLAFLCDNSLEEKRSNYVIGESNRPWLSLHKAKRLSRNKRQIVAECCDKPCSVDELLTYC
ncbi:unnamed protein product [Parnassius mnemosyne]|uniref:Insulin-like domain-containing protein n=1 Tax=Parnassius mnemosyne TaxID=213953 RepID=A0AAV1L9S0_9NEOP